MLKRKRIPIGYEDFKRIIDKNMYYVDKTMLIYDIVDSGGMVNLITRPRRFGKTLNFSMLRYFFDAAEKDSAYIFDGLKISEHYDELEEYRNAHPVISLSMKGGKQNALHSALDSLCYEIREEYDRYRFVLESDRLNEEDKSQFMAVLRCFKPDIDLYKESIKKLSRILKKYYGTNAIILIDEYDVPLENAYFRGFYDEMVGFIRSLFESALKTNDALEFAVITGCLRISKESIFTGLNNFEMKSILDEQYAEYFGFEEHEVKELLDFYGLEDKFETAKKWYDGYLFGDKEIYNPWSIMNYAKNLTFNRDAYPEAAWINSSSNSIIRKLVESSDESIRQTVEELINGGFVETYLNETVTYGDLDAKQENMWNFLFFTGYLKVKSYEWMGTKKKYRLVIPNIEIETCYTDIIIQYFDRYKREMNRDELYKALLERDADGFAEQITSLLRKSISYYDNAESFYHGLISGLLANNVYYRMESNRETGDGRADLALYQEDRFITAVIMEFKICAEDEEPHSACLRAIDQINEKHYTREAESRGYTNIIKYGIAFKGKLCAAAVE